MLNNSLGHDCTLLEDEHSLVGPDLGHAVLQDGRVVREGRYTADRITGHGVYRTPGGQGYVTEGLLEPRRLNRDGLVRRVHNGRARTNHRLKRRTEDGRPIGEVALLELTPIDTDLGRTAGLILTVRDWEASVRRRDEVVNAAAFAGCLLDDTVGCLRSAGNRRCRT